MKLDKLAKAAIVNASAEILIFAEVGVRHGFIPTMHSPTAIGRLGLTQACKGRLIREFVDKFSPNFVRDRFDPEIKRDEQRFFKPLKVRSWREFHRKVQQVTVIKMGHTYEFQPSVRLKDGGGFGGSIKSILIPETATDEELGDALDRAFLACLDEDPSGEVKH